MLREEHVGTILRVAGLQTSETPANQNLGYPGNLPSALEAKVFQMGSLCLALTV